MKMLLKLLIVPLIAAPAMAQAADKPVFEPDAGLTRTLNSVSRIPEATGLLAPTNAKGKISRVGRVSEKARRDQAIAAARARGSASELPSFAIKGGGDSPQSATVAGHGASAPAGIGAGSEPPVSFSFAASGQSYNTRNRYRGGVYMAAPF